MKFPCRPLSNGTLVDAAADCIRDVGYDYVGISLDGIGDNHDRFRRKVGAYNEALGGLRLLRDRGIKVGVRFTMTEDNAMELPRMLDLVEREGFHKFYLSHLVYAGRGNKNRGDDAMWQTTRDTMDMVIDRAWRWVQSGSEMEIVTGNDTPTRSISCIGPSAHAAGGGAPARAAQAVGRQFLRRQRRQYRQPRQRASGHDVVALQPRQRQGAAVFGDLTDLSDPIMAGLKQKPRAIGGRRGECAYFDVCNGNTRVRAMRITGDPWAEDPGCYLTDAEIGLAQPVERVKVSAYRGARHEAPLSL
jgi:MoaA/NifB/PqqE/SkfB family radical SAM enzyme